MLVCCGFAIFLIHQLLLPLAWWRKAVPGEVLDPAVMWRAQVARYAEPTSHFSLRRSLSRPMPLVLGLELVALVLSVGGAYAFVGNPGISGRMSTEDLLAKVPLCGQFARAS